MGGVLDDCRLRFVQKYRRPPQNTPDFGVQRIFSKYYRKRTLCPSRVESRTATLQFGMRALCPSREMIRERPLWRQVAYALACWYSLMTCYTRHAEPRLDPVPQRTTFLPVAPEQLLQKK